MNSRKTLRQVGIALMLLVAFLVQGTWALAGTTGGLSGVVLDDKNAPVAQATVTAASPSGSATSTTDAQGHYLFLQLAPDTYTVSISKKGYQSVTQPGITVFADQNQTVDLRTKAIALTEIGNVTSRAQGALVKSGVTADTYSINSQTIQKSAALGGGGNLDNAYSAIAAVPGVNVGIGGSGWNSNSVYIRGSQSYFSSFEFDGVPVNRAFDNYNSSTESTLGLQELQVYTGGGPAGSSSAGTSGFINQVIKTGTYPGFASLQASVGAPVFYHQLKAEVGGASPDRNFSYYGGLSGYNQGFRYIDSSNGAGLMAPGQPLSAYSAVNNATINGQGVVPECDLTGAPPASVGLLPNVVAANAAIAAGTDTNAQDQISAAAGSCNVPYSGIYGATANITDREDVANFHIKIPHKNGQKDDVQMLMSASSLQTTYLSSINDLGGPTTACLAFTGGPKCTPNYSDALIYDQPFGTTVTGVTPKTYFSPSSSTNRAFKSALPANLRDPIWNDTGIFKAQYTHPFSDRAYARVFGYTFFSDWNLTGAVEQYGCYRTGYICDPTAANYELITHTAGGELQLADQINNQNLLNLTANYTTAGVSRMNNNGGGAGGFTRGYSPVGLINKDAAGNYHCFDKASGAEVSCAAAKSSTYDLNPATFTKSSALAAAGAPAPPPCTYAAGGAAACSYASLWDGGQSATYNTVKPKFTYVSLTDQYRPNEKWLFNGGLRYERYQYDLANSNTPGTTFYSQVFNNNACYNPTTQNLAFKPLAPGQPPPQSVYYTSKVGAACSDPTAAGGLGLPGYYHLSGTDPGTPASMAQYKFSAQSPSSYALNYVSARFSGTYTMSPDTVIRFSAGRFVEPPLSAAVQYLNRGGDARRIWANSTRLGFFSPFHPIPGLSAAQYDGSLERRIKGTDMSFKLSPFYNFTHGYQQQSFIGQSFVTQVPVGDFRSRGIEFAFSKGDFNKDGLSGQVALTYTDAKVRYTDNFGQNQVNILNQAITEYNKLTKAGGGSPCYGPNDGGTLAGQVNLPDCTSATAIRNPYYNLQPSATLDKSAWYAPSGNFLVPGLNPGAGFYDAPWVGSLILNWRHDRLAITPSLQYSAGSAYGNPLDFVSLDPRVCGSNSATSGVTVASPATDPKQCDYLSATGLSNSPLGILYTPDIVNGNTSFPTIGAYRNPSILTGNMAVSYEMSKKVTAQLTLTNIFHTCFGGTKASWTSAYPAGSTYCGYGQNSFYTSNFYNGTSANDVKANGVAQSPFQKLPYLPSQSYGTGTIPNPFNAYLQFTVKI